MKRFSTAIVPVVLGLAFFGIIMVGSAICGTTSYPSRPAGGGPITRTVVWSFDETDIGDKSVASDPVYGHVERIVVESTGTDTSWGLTLTDAHGVTLFTKADLSSASEPYSYAIHLDDLNGDPHWGVPAHGALTLATANVANHGELQTLTMDAAAIDGTFTLSFGGETTTDLAYDASTATIDSALEALTTIGTGGVTVGGDTLASGSPTTFTFLATAGDVAMLTADFSVLGATAEVQTLTIDSSATAGTFTLTYEEEETSAIAYDASTATVQAALEALTGVTAGDITVGGTTLDAGGPMTFTFLGGLGDVDMLSNDVTLLTGVTTATFAETVKGVLADGTFVETTEYGAELTDITVTVYYLGNGN